MKQGTLNRSWWDHRDFIRIVEQTKTYDFSPWAIIQTDFKTYITIEALKHEKNVYFTGKKTFQYHQHRLWRWINKFDYLKSYQYGSIQVFKSNHSKTWNY